MDSFLKSSLLLTLHIAVQRFLSAKDPEQMSRSAVIANLLQVETASPCWC